MIKIEPLAPTSKGYSHNADIADIKVNDMISFVGKKYKVTEVKSMFIKAYSVPYCDKSNSSMREKTKAIITHDSITIQQVNDDAKVI